MELLVSTTTSVVDLFGGPGGLDVGARGLGIEPLGIELDDAACATREAAGLRTFQGDVATLDPADFAPCKGLLGSPPCPTFSAAGGRAGHLLIEIIVRCLGELAVGNDTRAQRRDEAYDVLEPVAWEAEQKKAKAKGRTPDRERSRAKARRDADMSLLVVEPLRWAVALRPEWIVLEQVPDVLPLWSVICQLLDGQGYSTWAGVLSAERYGVPQTRKRAILMASLGGSVEPPKPTHQAYVAGEPAWVEPQANLEGELQPWVSMADALEWNAEVPAPTVTGGGTASGGAEPFGRGGACPHLPSYRRTRGEGMTERDGERRAHPADEPAPTVTAKARSDEWEYDTRYGGFGADANLRGGQNQHQPSPPRDCRKAAT